MALTKEKGNPSFFLSNFLSNPATSIPKGAQWAVYFHDIKNKILPSIQEAYKGEPSSKWNTEKAAIMLASPEFQTRHGCMFCQAIGMPGEGMTPVAEGIKTNAYVRSYVGGGRNDFPVMRMSFLETNLSFADSILRGWALATSKFGMIARSDQKNYRTDMTCYKFGITPKGPFLSQTIHFNGICCIGLNEEEFNYDPMSAVTRRDAQFVYNSYYVDTVSGVDGTMFLNKGVK